jgi:hypothetical protein
LIWGPNLNKNITLSKITKKEKSFKTLDSLASKDSDNEKWVFRGQSDSNWKLTPSFLRPEQFDNFFKRCYKNDQDRISSGMQPLISDYITPKLSEVFKSEIFEFYAEYFKRNQRAEYIPRCELLDHSEDFQKFIDLAADYCGDGKLAIPEEISVPFLAYCQHYGIPTRLVDFSFNLQTAILFSLNLKSQNTCAIWCINIHDDAVKKVLKSYIPDYEINDNCHFQNGILLYKEQHVAIVNNDEVEFNDEKFDIPVSNTDKYDIDKLILDEINDTNKKQKGKYTSKNSPIKKFVYKQDCINKHCEENNLSINDLFVEKRQEI